MTQQWPHCMPFVQRILDVNQTKQTKQSSNFILGSTWKDPVCLNVFTQFTSVPKKEALFSCTLAQAGKNEKCFGVRISSPTVLSRAIILILIGVFKIMALCSVFYLFCLALRTDVRVPSRNPVILFSQLEHHSFC